MRLAANERMAKSLRVELQKREWQSRNEWSYKRENGKVATSGAFLSHSLPAFALTTRPHALEPSSRSWAMNPGTEQPTAQPLEQPLLPLKDQLLHIDSELHLLETERLELRSLKPNREVYLRKGALLFLGSHDEALQRTERTFLFTATLHRST